METSSPPLQAIDLSAPLYYQVVYTLTNLLPRSLDDTPSVVRIRNLAAIAKVAALLPVNANEADLAAQCIAARAQAEDILRLLRQHEDDIGLVLRLNAQYSSMQRTSLSLHGRLMRVQALRHKREAIDGAANQDDWTLHVAEQSMLAIVTPNAARAHPAWPNEAPVATPPTMPEAAPVATPTKMSEAAPAAREDQRKQEHISNDETNSQDAAFETWLSEQILKPGRSGEKDPREVLRKALAQSRLAGRKFPANSGENPATANHGRHSGGESAST